MISVQRDTRRKEYIVRLHHLFVDAPRQMLDVLAKYIVLADRQASRELGCFIDQRQDRIQQVSLHPATPRRTKGRIYDLQQLYDELNALYFEGQVCCDISWGRHVRQGRIRRSVKVGSYFVELNLIRIHPGLDQEWIPRFYIQWVIYHEMLHVVHPILVVNGRRRFHTSDFEKDERRFEHYEAATLWEKQNLASLLCI